MAKTLKAACASVLETARSEVATAVASGLQSVFDMGKGARSNLQESRSDSRGMLEFAGKSRPSFLQSLSTARQRRSSDGGFEVKLSTVAAPVPDGSIQDLMEKIEIKRAGAEKRIFDQALCATASLIGWAMKLASHGNLLREACNEMSALKKIALNALEVSRNTDHCSSA